MAICCFTTETYYDEKGKKLPAPIISLNKHACSICNPTFHAPKKIVKKVQIPISNFVYETWPEFAGLLDHTTITCQALGKVEAQGPTSEDLQYPDLPVEVIIELVPVAPHLLSTSSLQKPTY